MQERSLGRLNFSGARLTHYDYLSDGSNTLFSFVVARIRELKEKSGQKVPLQIVEWGKLDNEEMEKYLSQAEFARRLEKHLGVGKLWPDLELSDEEFAFLEKDLTSLCPSLRSEALLPDWEFQGEHKIPVIPEPLGIISLSREEKRVDPLTSMGAVLIVLFISLVIFIVFIFNPPWVPGV